MPDYAVIVEDPAITDVEEAYLHIKKEAPLSAERWFNRLFKAIYSLESMPFRCPLAPENDVFDEEIRHLIFGSYRIIFTVSHKAVYVLHIRRAARRPLEP